ncbi:MAG: hypothetical protein HQL46_02980 [Gammaproteobacteria bacterium]|nr:hypothetical protein [Gammaproteobacteria bacterium]
MRRIDTAMHKQGFKNYDDFFSEVLNNKLSFTKLFFDLSINVTQFLRQPASYDYLKNSVLPKIASYSHLKMWCAGVSSGEEAYTLASLLDSSQFLEKTIIYATDFNPYILQIAKNGLYSKTQVNSVVFANNDETEHFRQLFDQYDNIMSIKSRIAKHIHFFSHNLTTDASLGEFQLIICKNVLIYFDDDLQHQVLNLFYHSLSLDGYLILGESENIMGQKNLKLFKTINSNAKIYQRCL